MIEASGQNIRQSKGDGTNNLRDNTERPETITIGTDELIGTDPSKPLPALVRLMAGHWKKDQFLRNRTARQQSGSSSAWSDCWQRNKATSRSGC